jgi:diguanylate cyclase (GGDEF)-like protein
LNPEVERLRKRLERERRARAEAEQIAERSTRALYREVAERTRELESIVAMGREAAAALDSTSVGDLIAGHLARAVGFDECGIYAWERSDDLVRTVGYFPSERRSELRDVYPLAEFPETGRVLASRKVSVTDPDDPEADASEVRFLVDLGGALMLQIPIIVNGQATGTVELISRVGTTLDDRQIAIAQTMANEAGVLFENARLYAQIRHQAFYDHLTGLPNRALFGDRVTHALARRIGKDQRRSALLFVDIDDFKLINDRFGHDVGDQVLCAVARRLQLLVRPADTVARLAGDEFGVLVEDVTDQRKVHAIARRLVRGVDRPIDIGDRQLRVSASIGVAIGTVALDAESLIRNADFAMYGAKQSGKSQYRMYDPAARVAADVGAGLRLDLQKAVERSELRLHYQPIVDLRTGAVASVEALVRWQHPHLGLLHPAAFIPLAEDTGTIVGVGSWVLETACHQLRAWQADLPGLSLSVNVSGLQLQGTRIIDDLQRAICQSGIDPGSFILEMTETILIAEPAAEAMLRKLKELGARLAIDDFGTGYSSISYLRRFPFDILKIDMEFTHAIETPEGGGPVRGHRPARACPGPGDHRRGHRNVAPTGSCRPSVVRPGSRLSLWSACSTRARGLVSARPLGLIGRGKA